MNKDNFSRTALMVCLIRAASFREKKSQLNSGDSVAHIYILKLFELFVRFEFFRRLLQKKLPKGTYEYVVLRTKYIDDLMSKTIQAKKVEQVVILGAGFDTRSIRFNNGRLKYFEVDLPDTQKLKRTKLIKSKLSVGNDVCYIPFDISQMGFEIKLINLGFEPNKNTLFVLEGLLMYLEPNKVDLLLKQVNRLGGDKSQLILDYVQPVGMSGNEDTEEEIVKQIREPWVFKIAQSEIPSLLKKHGFRVVENVCAKELAGKYFAGLNVNVDFYINEIHCICHAKKN